MSAGVWPLKVVAKDVHTTPGTHYTTNYIDGDAMEILRDLEPDELNWVFLSTSGVHGSYASLDDIEADLPETGEVTVLIVLPRMVTTMYGQATVRDEVDVALLRKRVEQTMAGVALLQSGNREKRTDASIQDHRKRDELVVAALKSELERGSATGSGTSLAARILELYEGSPT